MRKLLPLLASIFLLNAILGAQSNAFNNNPVISTVIDLKKECAFETVRTKLRQNPEYILQEQRAENKIQKMIKRNLSLKSSSIYSIPVVVHVLHKNEAIGVGSNISDAQIESAIDRLTEYYRGDGGASLDFEVEFVLAKQDENCNHTTGINRVNASGVAGYSANGVRLETANGADENTLKALSKWDETQYFNIWIVSEIDGNNGGFGIQGYANFYYGNANEGSVMMASVFGYDPGNLNGWGLNSGGDAGTVIHEIGHYLHLHHTFVGDEPVSANVGTVCPSDVTIGTNSDGCADTEVHKRHTSQCLINGEINDCTGVPYGDNVSKNYMSYTSCRSILTNDQKTRVRNQLTGNMQSMITSRGDEAPTTTPAIAAAICSPTSTQAFMSSGVFSVELNGFTVSSAGALTDNNPNGYLDNSNNCSQYFSIDATIANSINATVGYNGSNHRLGVWIDWNNDGDFNDVNEEQHVSSGISSSSVVNVPLIYPASVNFNTTVRIRVVSDLDSGPVATPCGSPRYGQAEDYKLFIEPNVGGPPVADFSVSSTTLCSGSSTIFTDASTNTPTSWTWSFSPATVTYINSTSSASQNPEVQFNNTGSYRATLTSTNANGSDSEVKIGYIAVNSAAGNAGAIAGNSSACKNESGVVYSISTVNDATDYLWTVPPGATITSGQNTTSITLDFGTSNGSVSVTPGNSCGNGVASVNPVILNDCNITTIRPKFCGTIMSKVNQQVYATDIPGATQYEFRLVPQGGGSTINYVSCCTFRFNFAWFSGWDYNTTYNISVRAKINDTFTPYGASCPVTSPDITLPSIRPKFCGTIMSKVNQQVYATDIPGATQYEFRLVPQGGGSTINYVSCCTFRFNFAWFSGWDYNTTYNISVRVKINDTFTPYGASCPITSPSSLARIAMNNIEESDLELNSDLNMKVYPNPNLGEFVYIELDGLSDNSEIMVTDIYGKTILRKPIESVYKSYKGTIRFDQKLSSGLYLVTIISEDNKLTKKLVVR